jgi:hypothetical protein
MHKQMKAAGSATLMPIENFGDMQARYQIMPIASRALAVLSDAEAALTTAKRILISLEEQPKISLAIANLRKDSLLTSRVRASEAKTVLMDDGVDFIQTTTQKLTQWHRTLWLISQGKTKATIMKENVPAHLSISSVTSYLALIKIIIPELSKLDTDNKNAYDTMLAEIRRCTTILSDCECASEMNSVVLH